jgi:iron complex outermembrane receptor protein
MSRAFRSITSAVYRSPRSARLHQLAAAAATLALHLGAAAQQPATQPTPEPAAAPAGPGKLQAVTVTAERRAENIKDVPNSVSTISGELLDTLNSGGQDVRMLSGRVPSLNIESSFGRAFPRFYIRGIGNTDFDLNASQPVSLVFDDVVQENPILKGFPLFDLDRIEVLRGPQGTLFGRNSPAGVVKFESARPRLGRTEGYGAATLGQDTLFALEGAVNVPISASMAARVSLQSQNRGDWVDNTFDAGPTQELEGYRDNAFRAQLLFQPDSSFSLLANAHARDLKGSARLFRANIIKPGTNDLVDGFDPKKVSLDGVNDQELRTVGGNLRVRYAFGGLALSSITGIETVDALSRGDIDGGFGASFLGAGNFGPGFIPFAAESADGMPKHRQFTQELRLESTNASGFKWLGGVYFFDEVLNIDSFNFDSLAPGNPQNGYANQEQKNRAYAAFGSVNLDLTEQFKLRAGLRATRDTKEFVANRVQAPPFSPTFIGQRSTTTQANNVSGDISGLYEVTKDLNLYARVATGFRAPSIQGRLLFGDSLSVADSEKITSIEAGVKADLFDRRARAAFNVFSWQIRDQQLTAVGGNANFNQLVNADKTTGYGFELDLTGYATDNLLLGLSAGYNKTRIKDPGLRVDACGSGCTVLDPVTAPANPAIGKFAPTVSIDGNPLPQAPELTLNFTARYGFGTAAGGEFFVLTDWAYRSKVNFFLYESTEFTGKPLLEGGLRLGYLWGGGKYEAALFVRNLLDEVQAVGGIDFNNLTGFVNEPRTVGVQLRASF